MKRDPTLILKKFLEKHSCSSAPLLLGLSGGPDSLALFFSLAALQPEFGYCLHVAHVDHGWREGSSQEAKRLEQEIKCYSGVVFHGTRLDAAIRPGNLEDTARQKRLNYFKQLYIDCDCKALILGHHADDQAETVLKRLLEGAALYKLAGIRPVHNINGMQVWRPFLSLSKREILDFCTTLPMRPIIDETNADERFLRARMRQTIFPYLNEALGRHVQKNLVYLGERAQELDDYLYERIAPHLENVVDGPFGSWLDFSRPLPKEELRYLLRCFCDRSGIALSRESHDIAVQLIQDKTANRRLPAGKATLYVDRGQVFISGRLPSFENWSFKTQSGVLRDCYSDGWGAIWRGQTEVVLPPDDYQLAPPDLNASYNGHGSLSEWWTEHKVPAFLRHSVPVVWKGEKIVHEFLSGKFLYRTAAVGPKIALKICFDTHTLV